MTILPMQNNIEGQETPVLCINELKSVFQKLRDCNQINHVQMSELISMSQEIEIELRSKMLSTLSVIPEVTFPVVKGLLVPCVEYKNNCLHVFTPLTFERGTPDCYMISTLVRQAIESFQRETNINMFQLLTPPLQCVILRKVHKYSGRLRDNDNMETGRIINSIFSSLGISDNCMILRDYHCGFRIIPVDEYEGMEFIIFTEKSTLEHIHLLYDDE